MPNVHLIDFQTILIVALVFIPLERIFPCRKEQKVLRKHWLNDLVYLLLNGIPINFCLVALFAAMTVGVRIVVPEAVGEAVRSQPLWLETVELIVLADVGFYLAHRMFHAVPFLWRFHVIHHSIEEMDWLAAHRVHPVDQVLTKAASFLPVFALGFSSSAIVFFALFYKWQSVLIHSNIRLDFGPLKWIVVSPQFHHWHHANERGAFNKNFAAQLPFIDALGGTLFMPINRMPAKYGTDETVPTLYHQQLAYPLLRRQAASQVA